MAALEHGHGRAQPGQLEGGAQPADPGADTQASTWMSCSRAGRGACPEP